MYNFFQHLTASQGTAVETLRAQLAEANERINKLSADMHERKSGYKHSQLEELRNLQTTVQKEKQDWERHKAKELQMMEAERAQLEEMRSILAKQEVYDISDKDVFNTHYDKKRIFYAIALSVSTSVCSTVNNFIPCILGVHVPLQHFVVGAG